MSFGGFIGGVGDVTMVGENLYNSSIPNSSITHSQQLMVSRPPPFSRAVKPKMEGAGEMGLLGESFGFAERHRDEENDSRSGSDHNEAASGDDLDAAGGDNSARRKKYHRHTQLQIQELEAAFKENPHPDEKARLELGRRLNLEGKQVKFWFQNRRTQMKTQMERHENSLLKHDNDRLRIENITMKEAMKNPVCSSCGGPAAIGDISIEEQHLRIENARLRDELNRVCLLSNKLLGRPLSLSGPIPPGHSDLELAVGRNGIGGVSPVAAGVPTGLNFGSGGMSSPMPVLPTHRSSVGMTSLDFSIDKSMYLELAMAATDEFMKLTQVDGPLWLRGIDGIGEVLNMEEYTRSFPPCIGMKPNNFTSEATRASGTLILNGASLIEVLMDENRWIEMFSCMLGKASIIDVISSGVGGTRNGALHMMHAEFQVLSPLVRVRQAKFVRFCKQQAEGCWSVVDISVDSNRDGPLAQTFADCRRLPSGCIVQELPNGYSKVIWVEHMEYDDSSVPQFFRPFLRSGLAIGAQKWVATLERQCEFLAILMSSTVLGGDEAVITPSGRKSLANLAQRMSRNFCAGVCSTLHQWDSVPVGGAEGPRLMLRKSQGNPGEPQGMLLCASLTVWLPVSRDRLFDYLRNEQTRNQWDILSRDGPIQQMLHIAKGKDFGNSISLMRASGTSDHEAILILQEASTDVSGSLIVYGAIDTPSMNVVMGGGDSSCVVLLPSGFAIFPDCYPESPRPDTEAAGAGAGAGSSSSGSLLTMGFQILVNSLPTSKLTLESVDTVNELLTRTVQAIRSAFQCIN